MAEGQSASSLAAFAYQPASNLAVQREPSPEAAVDAPPQTVSHDPFASDSGSAASADEQEAAGEPQAGQPPPARAGEEPEEAPADTAEASSPAAAPVRSPEAADSARRAEAPDRPAQNPAEAAAGHDEPNRPVLSMKLADPPTNGVPVVEAVGSDLPKGEQEEASEEEEQESEEEEEEESEGYQEGSEESGEESEAYEEESGEESEEEEESEDDEAPRRKPGRAKVRVGNASRLARMLYPPHMCTGAQTLQPVCAIAFVCVPPVTCPVLAPAHRSPRVAARHVVLCGP